MKIGFIGLGVMGAPMARHLADAGHEIVTVLNLSPLPEDLKASVVASPAEVARVSEIVITMLPDTPDVERVPARLEPEPVARKPTIRRSCGPSKS